MKVISRLGWQKRISSVGFLSQLFNGSQQLGSKGLKDNKELTSNFSKALFKENSTLEVLCSQKLLIIKKRVKTE